MRAACSRILLLVDAFSRIDADWHYHGCRRMTVLPVDPVAQPQHDRSLIVEKMIMLEAREFPCRLSLANHPLYRLHRTPQRTGYSLWSQSGSVKLSSEVADCACLHRHSLTQRQGHCRAKAAEGDFGPCDTVAVDSAVVPFYRARDRQARYYRRPFERPSQRKR